MQKIYINQYRMSNGVWWCAFGEHFPQSAEERNKAVANRRKTIGLLRRRGHLVWNHKEARTITVTIPTT